MKKVLVSLFALSLAGSLYAGSGCGSCTKKSTDKVEDKVEKEVIAQGSETKECDSSEKKCDKKSDKDS
ncbi:MAG: hypothetical protein PF795_05655 [Kiritimatiellae bacterium]|jgi:hypothetical protein|nr:hypothetical protein [Kiritimatiellia bacterium]